MKLQTCSYELSRLAKEANFPQGKIYGCYNVNNRQYFKTKAKNFDIQITAPSLDLLCKWLRGVHNVILLVYYESEDADSMAYAYTIQTESDNDYDPCHIRWTKKDSWWMNSGYWPTYEEALEQGLFKALQLI